MPFQDSGFDTKPAAIFFAGIRCVLGTASVPFRDPSFDRSGQNLQQFFYAGIHARTRYYGAVFI
jgi:hypothetical protein